MQVTDDRPEVLDIKDKVREVSNGFNPEVSGSLRPNGHKDLELREWEKNILVHLNNVNLIERDDRKTSYVKFKLFKLWAAEKVIIPAGSSKLVKVRTEGNWTGATSYFRKMPMTCQEVCRLCM